VLFGGLLLTLAGARWLVAWNVPLPRCLFHELTARPCAFCGGTHCLVAAAQGDFRTAFAWNPLTFLGVVAIGMWFVGWLFSRATGWQMPAEWRRRLQAWPWGWLLLVAVALNWIYLWFTFPR
jgi:hypothetical protein